MISLDEGLEMEREKETKQEANSPSFLLIDDGRLDWEWTRQAVLYHEHAVLVAEARDKLADARKELELTEAQLDKRIRKDPAKYDLGEKVTETIIRNAIVRHTKYQEALQAVNKASYEANIHQAVVDALEHKKKALEHRVTLFLHDYHAEPKPPKGQYTAEELDDARVRMRKKRNINPDRRIG